MLRLNTYDKNGRIKKPVLLLFSFFSVWQMVILWVSSTTGYIAQFSLIDMPASANYTYYAYAGLLAGAVMSVLFPKQCLLFCRIFGTAAVIGVALCFFNLGATAYSIVFCLLTVCAALLTASYVALMIFSFKLRDIWIEALFEITLIGVFSLTLLNGAYEVPFEIYNAVSLISLVSCTASYFMLDSKKITYKNIENTKPPISLFAFLAFMVFATMFTLTITTMLPQQVEYADAYIFTGQILTAALLFFLDRKNVNLYNMINICAIISVVGLILILADFALPLACLFLGSASAISVIGMLIGGYAFSKYKSRLIPAAAVILSGLATGVGEIIYRLFAQTIDIYLMVMIGIFILFIAVYEFLVPIIQYRLGYGGILLREDYSDIAKKLGASAAAAANGNNPQPETEESAPFPEAEPQNTCKNGSSAFDSLTAREKEIAALILSGYTGTQISATLFISLSTVKTHTKNIYSKLDINTKKELFDLAKSSAQTKDAH